jgi:hypothetical protein
LDSEKMPWPGHWLARCALPKKSNTPIVLPGFESKWLAVQTNCSSLHMEILKHDLYDKHLHGVSSKTLVSDRVKAGRNEQLAFSKYYFLRRA